MLIFKWKHQNGSDDSGSQQHFSLIKIPAKKSISGGINLTLTLDSTIRYIYIYIYIYKQKNKQTFKI